MNKDDMIRLAREAGWEYANGDDGYDPLWRFAELVAATERNSIEQKIHKLDITLPTRLYVINYAIRARANNGT